MTATRTTLLEAVNRVLQMMGEAPVNGLDGQYGLAQQANDIIQDTSRRIQTDDWSFNTDRHRLLQREVGTNFIQVSNNTLRVVVDLYEYSSLDVVQRGSRLYDRAKGSYQFDQDLHADVTYFLDWEELPEHARQYIVAAAGRQLQEAIIGSNDLGALNIQREAEARALFLDEETNISDHSMLRGNPNHSGVVMSYMPSRAVRRM